ncbi:hypothetical protein DMA10_12100 [Streptomyces sp. WAC 01420]|nr:hypothetical protein DLM49_15350 [Streptomyces sp. WAC 01438]RSM97010.1 hypothetical protein DMA10_12100 [Streptomyces sp. WAC 01420]
MPRSAVHGRGGVSRPAVWTASRGGCGPRTRPRRPPCPPRRRAAAPGCAGGPRRPPPRNPR